MHITIGKSIARRIEFGTLKVYRCHTSKGLLNEKTVIAVGSPYFAITIFSIIIRAIDGITDMISFIRDEKIFLRG